jgi:hypothetical protein
MRIACLVMGYIAPAVLARSVPILREAGWEVFVHVDRKVAMDGYRRAMGDAAQSCVFVASPVEVFWGGYSMIAAELLLIETARKHAAYDKFLLLSDDSFPVLPPDALRRHFDNESDQITLRRVREGTPTHARYRDFVCYDDVATTIRDVSTVVPGSPLRVIRPELEKRIAEIAALRRRGKKRLQLYYGQGLWALTKATLDIVTRTIETDRHLQRSFVYSALPDETMIHSIVGNFVRPTEQEATPVYVNYSGGAPVVYAAMTDLPLDLRETHAFLRKLSPTATETLDILAARLQTGRTIHDQIPGEANAPLWIVDEAGTRRQVIRLSAPDEIGSAEGWHAIEVFWGRRFRWTARETVVWPLPPTGSENIRIVLSMVIPVEPNWLSGCRLRVGGREAPAAIRNGDLVADFDDVSAAEATLTTPTLWKLAGPASQTDTRRLGLPVAV